MPVPYHTHNFELPFATKQDVVAGVATDKIVVPATLGSAAVENVAAFATAAQGERADLATTSKRKIITNNGLEGGGDLSEDRIIGLSKETLAALDNAQNAASKKISIKSGAGLTGGGDLNSSIIELSLNVTSLNAISQAQSAVQPKDIGILAKKNKITIADIDAIGNASSSNFLSGDGRWVTISADNIKEGNNQQFVTASEKSQIAKIDDLFDSDNIAEGSSNLFFKASERRALATIVQIQNSFVGQIAFFPASNPPKGWLKANGALLLRSAYRTLWNFAITCGFVVDDQVWNSGQQGCFSRGMDDGMRFRVPDLRGEFLRGFDDARGVDNGRVLGSLQSDAIRNITGSVGAAGGVAWQGAMGAFRTEGGTASLVSATQNNMEGVNLTVDASRIVPTASENRPRNIALLACIRYEG